MPVIALTADAMKGTKQECIDAGFNDYHKKPISIDSFVEKMATFLGAIAIDGSSEQNSELPVEDQLHIESVDEIVTTLPQNDTVLVALAQSFAEKLGPKLDEMLTMSVRGDNRALAELAHWLKGAGGTVGFDVLTLPSTHLEVAVKSADVEKIRQALAEVMSVAARIKGVVPGVEVLGLVADAEVGVELDAKDMRGSDITAAQEPLLSSVATIPNMMPLIASFVEELATAEQQMEDALTAGNFEKLAVHARWLKGSGGTMGFEHFTEPATELEQCAKNAHSAAIPKLLLTISQLRSRIQLPQPAADS